MNPFWASDNWYWWSQDVSLWIRLQVMILLQGLNWFKPDVRIILFWKIGQVHLNSLMTKPTKWPVRPAKTQIRLGIRPVWSESLLFTWRKPGSWATQWAYSEDSDRTGRMPRLIWVRRAHRSLCWFCHEAAHFVISGVSGLLFCHYFFSTEVLAGPGSLIRCVSNWYSGGRGFDPPVRKHSVVDIGHETISVAILSLPLIQVGQLSVTFERMCTKYWLKLRSKPT